MLGISISWLILLVDTSIKAFLLALVVWIAFKGLRVRDPGVRHRVWVGVLAGMLLMPIIAPMLPSLRLPIAPSAIGLVAWMRANRGESAERSVTEGPSREERPMSSPWAAASDAESTGPARVASDSAPDASSEHVPLDAPQFAEANLLDRRIRSESRPSGANSSREQTDVGAAAEKAAFGAACLWFAVSTLLLLRLAAGLFAAYRIRLLAQPIDSGRLRFAEEKGPIPGDPCSNPNDDVTVKESGLIQVPVTVGPWRPTILLPRDWPTWSPEKLRAVIAHERSHAERHDCLVALAAELNGCLFWFHPLAWWLKAQLAVLAEQACDDAAIDSLGSRTQYARLLLEVAAAVTRQRGRLAPIGVSMARRSNVETRIHAILDFARPLSRGISRRTSVMLMTVMASAIVVTAMIRPTSGQPQANAVPATGTVASPKQSAGAGTPARPNPAFAGENALVASDPPKPADDASRSGDQSSAQASAPANPSPAAGPDQTKSPSEPVAADKAPAAMRREIQGRVIGSLGQAVPGAKITWFRSHTRDLVPAPPKLAATTNAAGEFRFELPDVDAQESYDAPAWSQQDHLVVTSPGYGFLTTSPEGLTNQQAQGPSGLLGGLLKSIVGGLPPVQLPAAGEPLRGRLVSIDGQPLAGVTVRIRWFDDARQRGFFANRKSEGADAVSDWQERVNWLMRVIEPAGLRDALPSATTDAEGRFEIPDVGANRLFRLLVQGPSIESTTLVVRNQSGKPIVIPPDQGFRSEELTLQPLDFVAAVGPSKPVSGRVFDLDTGDPISGAVVRAYSLHGINLHSSRGREEFSTTTGDDGSYVLTGLPIGANNLLVAIARGDVPYFPVGARADTSKSDTIEHSFGLKRGVWAVGRVYDAETNKPFHGQVSYYWFRDKELEAKIPGLALSFLDELYWTNRNGEFRLPVLPVRGILAFNYSGMSPDRDGIDHFPRGYGAEGIAGSEKIGSLASFPTMPHYLIPTNYERVGEVHPQPGDTAVLVDLPLYSSQPIQIRPVTEKGKPLSAWEIYGANERWNWQKASSSEFAVSDCRPGERRKVFVFDRKLGLAGGTIVDRESKQPVEVKLQRAGRLSGRLVDQDGQPIVNAVINADFERLNSDETTAIWANHPTRPDNPTQVRVDEQGRFQMDGLIPGWSYSAWVSAPKKVDGMQFDSFHIGVIFTDLKIEPGQAKDLGDVSPKEATRK